MRFYSTLVRLKANSQQVPEHSQSRFYSTLVRLKEKEVKTDIPDATEFLFHTGSIKRARAAIKAEYIRSFYSTLVRLKVGRHHSEDQRSEVSIPHWFD